MNLGLIRLGNWHSTLCRDISSSSKIKSPVFTLLTVCLAASGILAQTQSAFAATTRQLNPEEAQHLVCVKEGQHLLCDVEGNTEKDTNQDLAAKNSSETLKSSTITVPQLLTSSQQNLIANNFLWLSYLLPGGLALGLFMYDKYSGYRLAVLKEQIDTLEKVWKHSTRP